MSAPAIAETGTNSVGAVGQHDSVSSSRPSLAALGGGCNPEIEAPVTSCAPEGSKVESAENVLLDDAAGALAIEFVAAAIHADAGRSFRAADNQRS